MFWTQFENVGLVTSRFPSDCAGDPQIFVVGWGPMVTSLQALTLFYVGGASSASKLLSCQGVDGDKSPLPDGLPGPRDAL